MSSITDSQKNTIMGGLTILSFAVTFAFIALVVWGLFRFLAYTSTVVVPIFVAFFLALFFKPYYNWWKRLLRNPTLSLIVMLITIIVPLSFITWQAGTLVLGELEKLFNQSEQFAQEFTAWTHATFPQVYSFMGKFGIEGAEVSSLFSDYGGAALKAGSSAIKCLSGIASFILAMVFFIFFITTKDRRGGDIVAQFSFLKEETRAFIAEQIDAFFEILVGFFRRQTIICLIEGVMYGLGFLLVGLPYGFLIGFILGVLNLIPFFGSVVCLPIALPVAYFCQGGSTLRLALVLIVWLCGQFLDGYFITPKIQGNKTGLGYVGVIFSFFFWAIVLGPILGMLLAIPLSAFCVVLWRALKAKYIKPVM